MGNSVNDNVCHTIGSTATDLSTSMNRLRYKIPTVQVVVHSDVIESKQVINKVNSASCDVHNHGKTMGTDTDCKSVKVESTEEKSVVDEVIHDRDINTKREIELGGLQSVYAVFGSQTNSMGNNQVKLQDTGLKKPEDLDLPTATVGAMENDKVKLQNAELEKLEGSGLPTVTVGAEDTNEKSMEGEVIHDRDINTKREIELCVSQSVLAVSSFQTNSMGNNQVELPNVGLKKPEDLDLPTATVGALENDKVKLQNAELEKLEGSGLPTVTVGAEDTNEKSMEGEVIHDRNINTKREIELGGLQSVYAVFGSQTNSMGNNQVKLQDTGLEKQEDSVLPTVIVGAENTNNQNGLSNTQILNEQCSLVSYLCKSGHFMYEETTNKSDSNFYSSDMCQIDGEQLSVCAHQSEDMLSHSHTTEEQIGSFIDGNTPIADQHGVTESNASEHSEITDVGDGRQLEQQQGSVEQTVSFVVETSKDDTLNIPSTVNLEKRHDIDGEVVMLSKHTTDSCVVERKFQCFESTSETEVKMNPLKDGYKEAETIFSSSASDVCFSKKYVCNNEYGGT